MEIQAVGGLTVKKKGERGFSTGELGYDRLNGTRKIGPSYARSIVHTYDEHLICIRLGPSI